MINKMRNLIVVEEGQGMTEYGLVLGVITVAVLVAITTRREKILTLFNTRNNALDAIVAP